ncbi:helix-turn-helix transcriptional regulator [Oscillatoria sp. CS-180]|uniref:helix-turn-helix transcriptional regulator n=1 Tax=Oscillatoria sp. CS-180 TaxID=3021720 RepID=UPI00232F8CB4|nr:helix-turn-helix transcriptional regulator [Oscillatoria sp. CS-180]MDB9528419.1 helix-turn-helix transcriptional regulator [Oscillatoria sp. CS-180]
MKPGSKYYPLYERLSQNEGDTLALTIDEIEALLPTKLPSSARVNRSWWSNRNSGALQATAWIEAGYLTEIIDLDTQTITFKKPQETYVVQQVNGQIKWDKLAIRSLRKYMKMTQSQFAETMGVRRQTISEWENGVYLPDRSTMKHLGLVAEKESFEPLFEDELPTEIE